MSFLFSGRDATHLLELAGRARAAGLPHHAVQDAGRTEVEPGTLTVLAVAGPDEAVDAITGDLRLY